MISSELAQIIIRFLFGGSIVVLVTALAEQNSKLWSGIINNFPAMTAMSLIILLTTVSKYSAVKLAKETLYTLPIYIAFLAAFVVLCKYIDSKFIAITLSFAVWFVVTYFFILAGKGTQ